MTQFRPATTEGDASSQSCCAQASPDAGHDGNRPTHGWKTPKLRASHWPLLGGRGACSRTVRALLECADLLRLQGARSPRGAVGSARLVAVVVVASWCSNALCTCAPSEGHSVMVASAPAVLAREVNLGMHHPHVACQCVVA